MLLLLGLSSCATTGTIPVADVDSVTKTLLISQTFGRFRDAIAVSTDQFANTYVVDRGAPAVIKYGPTGDSLGVISGFGRDQYQFDGPIDIDARLTNSILIADYNNHRIERYTRDFAYAASLERNRDDQEQLNFGYPTQVAADDAGNIYLIDGENKRILRASSSMRLERVVGAYTNAGSSAGAVVNPTKLAVDGYENVLVYDEASRALVSYDNLGNLLKRRDQVLSLTSPAQVKALATRSDTLFVLISWMTRTSDIPSHTLMLFNTRSLTRLGRWDIAAETNLDLRDLDARNGITLVTSDRVLRANVSMTLEGLK